MSIVSAISRLSLNPIKSLYISKNAISTNTALCFRVTPCLLAEPLKKKKKLDPSIIKAREDRKKKKIEKQIRKLEKNARQLKPIEECEISLEISENKSLYVRKSPKISLQVSEERILLEKQWTNYKRKQHLADVQMLDRIVFSQQRALDELRKESEELYQEAIQEDFTIIPRKIEGPTNTPVIKEYYAPDGDYLDVSKKW